MLYLVFAVVGAGLVGGWTWRRRRVDRDPRRSVDSFQRSIDALGISPKNAKRR